MEADKLFVLVYPNQDGNTKRFNAATYYLAKIIIKNYNDIINENNFYDQPVDYDIKQYKGIRKLKTGQEKDYTTG